VYACVCVCVWCVCVCVCILNIPLYIYVDVCVCMYILLVRPIYTMSVYVYSNSPPYVCYERRRGGGKPVFSQVIIHCNMLCILICYLHKYLSGQNTSVFCQAPQTNIASSAPHLNMSFSFMYYLQTCHYNRLHSPALSCTLTIRQTFFPFFFCAAAHRVSTPARAHTHTHRHTHRHTHTQE
jgi:hypothetical protein